MHWAERKAMERRGRIACVEKKRRGERRMTKKLKGGGGGCSKHKAQGTISFIAKHVPDPTRREGEKV